MQGLLKFGDGIDSVNHKFSIIADWMVLFGVTISAWNATIRYFNRQLTQFIPADSLPTLLKPSNAMLEAQWFTFAILILLGSSYVLRLNEHVRVDIFYAYMDKRQKLWVDTLGIIFFLLPATLLLMWFCARYGYQSYMDNERSFNAGGLPYWPIKLLMPLGFFMLSLQGISELIKRIAALRGVIDLDVDYKKPEQ